MTEHLRDRLHEEMAGFPPPPADNLVALAVADGLRSRKARRTASGLGTVAVVGLTVLAVTIGSQLGGPASGTAADQAGSGTAPAVAKVAPKVVAKPEVAKATLAEPTAAAAVTEATASQAAPTAGTMGDKLAAAQAWKALQTAAKAANPPQWTPAPSGVPATPQGELQLFSDLATPYGTATHFAVSSDADKTHVSAYLTNAAGKTGDVQFSLYHDTLGYAGDCVQPAPNDISCHPTKGGGYVIVANDHAGCVNTADITVVHPDGTAVWITLASCLKDNATNTLTPGTQTLSAADVEAIFTNSGFDFTMSADVVARGAQNIGPLATFW